MISAFTCMHFRVKKIKNKKNKGSQSQPLPQKIRENKQNIGENMENIGEI